MKHAYEVCKCGHRVQAHAVPQTGPMYGEADLRCKAYGCECKQFEQEDE